MGAGPPIANAAPFELAILVGETLTLTLGIAITVIAYRGYRRNDSRPMFFIALGFILVVGLPGILGGLFLFGGLGNEIVIAGVSQVFELAGMASILYAISMNP